MPTDDQTLLASLVRSRYGFPDPTVELLRSYTNDVYLVTNHDARYALKVYGTNWRTDPEILFEMELLNHLADGGVPVASPVSSTTQHHLTHLFLAGQRRQVVLFEYAPGSKPAPPFSPTAYHRQGAATASMHLASETFATMHQRRPLDIDHLITQPIALVRSLPVDSHLKHSITRVGDQLQTAIETLVKDGLEWGICHGDVAFDNVHLTEDGTTTWYDFDSGGPGWRALDLQGWAQRDPVMREWQSAFLTGYRTIRDIDEKDVAASPYLHAAQSFWSMEVELERRILSRGIAETTSYLEGVVPDLMDWAEFLGLTSL